MWSGSTFFDGWEFQTFDDPTHGTVDYQPQSSGLGYYNSASDSVIMKVDNTGSAASRGRKSVRIHSNEQFNEGLFILDTNRIPFGCGTWPAFWLYGPSWPDNGEIDVIEGVHNDAQTHHVLHTANTCDYSDYNTDGLFTGSWGSGKYGNENRNCWVDDPDQWANQGCGLSAAEGTHGESWTNGGGGVTVLLWRRDIGIKIWDLQRSLVPSVMNKDVSSISDSDIDALGTPAAFFPFGSACTADTFNNNQIVFNIALCGDWAGGVWDSSGCAASTGYSSCSDFVWNNPSSFNDAYWDINYLKVFQYDSSGTDTDSDCGYVPSSCSSDLSWAVNTGTSQYSSYYPNFEEVTGVELTSASEEDMVLYWHCVDANPNGNCDGLQIPCNRECYPSSSCGNVPDSCQSDLEWAATTGTKSYSWWYPDFESITGVSLSAAGTEDVQLYWYCKGENPNGNCDGLEAPCGRSCGGSAFTADEDTSSSGTGHWVWVVIASALLIGCVCLALYLRLRPRKISDVSAGDEVTLRDDEQLQAVDTQMIELEDSVGRDGDHATIEITA